MGGPFGVFHKIDESLSQRSGSWVSAGVSPSIPRSKVVDSHLRLTVGEFRAWPIVQNGKLGFLFCFGFENINSPPCAHYGKIEVYSTQIFPKLVCNEFAQAYL